MSTTPAKLPQGKRAVAPAPRGIQPTATLPPAAAANSLSRAKGPMREYVRHGKGRLDKAEGIVAGAHKLARILWAMISAANPTTKPRPSTAPPPPPSDAAKTSPTKPAP